MLVLSRNVNQSIIIGGNIEVTVVEIRGDKVRLGILADRAISVHRGEIQAAIDARTKQATQEEENADGHD